MVGVKVVKTEKNNQMLYGMRNLSSTQWLFSSETSKSKDKMDVQRLSPSGRVKLQVIGRRKILIL